MNTYPKAYRIVIGIRRNPSSLIEREKVMRKVNLSDIQSELVSRGRKPFTDHELETAIKALDANDPNDGFIYAECDTEAEDYASQKAKYRNRVMTVSDQLGIAVSAQWTINGELVVALKQSKKRK